MEALIPLLSQTNAPDNERCPLLQGTYCPTTCGVADYMLKYLATSEGGLDQMLRDLETIANVTQDAEETVVYMKDSMAVAQKTNTPGNGPPKDPCPPKTRAVWVYAHATLRLRLFVSADVFMKKSANMLDDVVRFEKTISVQEQQIL